jgi:DNA-binding NtrC family response regulator
MTTTCAAKKILVVDDDPDFLLQLKLQAEAAASSAAERRQVTGPACSTWPMSIIDFGDGAGRHGLALVPSHPGQDPKTPIIMVTGVTRETGSLFDASTPEEWSWIGAQVVLDKPVRFEQLKRKMERLFRRKQLPSSHYSHTSHGGDGNNGKYAKYGNHGKYGKDGGL